MNCYRYIENGCASWKLILHTHIWGLIHVAHGNSRFFIFIFEFIHFVRFSQKYIPFTIRTISVTLKTEGSNSKLFYVPKMSRQNEVKTKIIIIEETIWNDSFANVKHVTIRQKWLSSLTGRASFHYAWQ